jgi:ubiquinone biosynthesis protein COQ9
MVKQQILDKVIEHVPFEGWTNEVLKKSVTSIGKPAEYATIMFPNGVGDLVQFFIKQNDAKMLEELQKIDVNSLKIRERIFSAIKIRIELNGYNQALAARTMSYLSLHPSVSVKSLSKTCDLIWNWAGDNSTDYNYYTKRIMLSGVYSSTLLFWVSDDSDDYHETWEFLNHRIENIMQINKLKSKISDLLPKKAC